MVRQSPRKAKAPTTPAETTLIEQVDSVKTATQRRARVKGKPVVEQVEIVETRVKVEEETPKKRKAKANSKLIEEVELIDTKVQIDETKIQIEETTSRKRRTKSDKGSIEEVQIVETSVKLEEKTPKKRKVAVIKGESHGDSNGAEKPATKKRKTKAEKEAELMPLAARTTITSLKRAMYIGAHVSAAGGVQNSIQNATHIGANAFALFLKSQRKWENPPLADENRDHFHAFLKEHNFDAAQHILPHGSYLVNLAQLDADKANQAYTTFLDDLQRCEALGIKLYNFHPGSTGGEPRDEAVARIASQLNRAHKATESVVTLLENMCGSGNVIGSTFEELRDVIALVTDKNRVGVCLDTCHGFAAGYDLRSPEAFAKTMQQFDEIVGLGYLKALHMNDSKAPLGSHRDLHANIGTGFLGLQAFHNVMNFATFQNLPMVLETPIDTKGPDGKVVENKQVWADEIKLLESLIGMDIESSEFKDKEKQLHEKGVDERSRIQEQVDKKVEKDAKKAAGKGRRKGKKKDEEESEQDSE